LNCASTSPLPASAEQAGREAMAFKRTPWLIGPEGLPNGPEAARAGFAALPRKTEASAQRELIGRALLAPSVWAARF